MGVTKGHEAGYSKRRAAWNPFMLTSSTPTPPLVRRGVVLAPTTLTNGFEVSVHECPKALLSELSAVMPERRGALSGCHIIASVQHSCLDLVKMGPEIDAEKDRLLENVSCCCSHGQAFYAVCLRVFSRLVRRWFLIRFRFNARFGVRLLQFVTWSKELCANLEREGFWADYIDPCSGMPVSFCVFCLLVLMSRTQKDLFIYNVMLCKTTRHNRACLVEAVRYFQR
jgi:hypothetical protein